MEEVISQDSRPLDKMVYKDDDGTEYEVDTVSVVVIVNKRVDGRTVQKIPGKAEFIGAAWNTFSLDAAVMDMIRQAKSSQSNGHK